MKQTSLIAGAEKILTNGTSAFHKTGHSAVSFLRALLGFEAEMLKEGIVSSDGIKFSHGTDCGC
jgi:Protein of unknown function (DUF3808)